MNATTDKPHLFTRVGSTNGPLAGPYYYAQMLVGLSSDNLSPAGVSWPHSSRDLAGMVVGPIVEVPGIPPDTFAFIQMVAWDSRLWGTSLANVPDAWLGKTDIVQHELGRTDGIPPPPPISLPRFTQPAIIPVPEPSALALAGLASAVLFLWRLRRNARSDYFFAALTLVVMG